MSACFSERSPWKVSYQYELSARYQSVRLTYKILTATASNNICKKRYSSPYTCLEWPRGFQEFKVPRFHNNGTGWL